MSIEQVILYWCCLVNTKFGIVKPSKRDSCCQRAVASTRFHDASMLDHVNRFYVDNNVHDDNRTLTPNAESRIFYVTMAVTQTTSNFLSKYRLSQSWILLKLCLILVVSSNTDIKYYLV